MIVKPVTFLCAGVIAANLFIGSATAQIPATSIPGEAAKTKAFMRQKLLYTVNALEGLTLERYDLVIDNAQLMRNMTQSNIFFRIDNKDYKKKTAEFSRSIDRLIKGAQKKKLKDATKAFNQVTQSCVECHRWFRTEQRTQPQDKKP